VRVNSKGQVTIPLELRRHFGIDEQTEIEFAATEDGIVLVIRNGSDGQLAVERMRAARQRATHELSTDEIMRLTRGWSGPDPGLDV
jgi:AbrB family looped-hinge helix DNA binding protein